ncbi:DUF4241 domain-containing protein [Heyndrickxia sp. FSL K6-6286]|uniref:DUF4241 domain-containing protein n=1 Tax=Heyndrickxia sp. FSL K6-6286 TaxID=2921510 RepID=UPI00315AF5C6
MAKRFYEVIEVKSGVPVDFLVLDSLVDPKRYALVKEWNGEFELRRVTAKSGELTEKMIEWYEHYRNEFWDRGEQIGSVGVDSGMLMIADPCYVKEATDSKCEEIFKQVDNESKSAQILNSYCLGFEPGYGDGIYDVYAKRDRNGHIIKIEIDLE